MKTEEYQIISRAEAKAQGLKYYFTGEPCKNGGIGERRVNNKQCRCELCRKKASERQSLYQKENRDKVVEYRRSYYERNRNKIAERVRHYYEEKREKIIEYSGRYYQENRDTVLDSQRRYREENPSKIAEQRRRYREENREALLESKRRYYEENREKLAESKRRYIEDNRDDVLHRHRRYYAANRHKFFAHSSKRRAAKRQAIPLWFGEFDQFVIEEAYELAKRRESETGIKWNVDHMVPLRARNACGLHCASNIQVIPAEMNLSKNNKMVLTKPLEWLRVWKRAHNVSMHRASAAS